ncbi:unnamed protein product [Alopecurus aequalis]
MPDSRSLSLCGTADERLKTSALYKLHMLDGELFPQHDLIWRSRAPTKVKFFAWPHPVPLEPATQEHPRRRLQRLPHLRCRSGNSCSCGVRVPLARQLWLALGATRTLACQVGEASTCPLPPSAPPKRASTLRLLCLWHIWKHRNGVVFNGLALSLATARKNCRSDAALWRVRLPSEQRPDVDLWLAYLQPSRT